MQFGKTNTRQFFKVKTSNCHFVDEFARARFFQIALETYYYLYKFVQSTNYYIPKLDRYGLETRQRSEGACIMSYDCMQKRLCSVHKLAYNERNHLAPNCWRKDSRKPFSETEL